MKTEGTDRRSINLQGEVGGGNNLAGACREKVWDEMSLEEKIERLRRVLQATSTNADIASRNAAEAKTLAEVHVHGLTGQVFKPAQDGFNLASDRPRGYRGHDPLA